MMIDCTFLSQDEREVTFPSKAPGVPAGTMDKYMRRIVQVLDNENKVFVFSPRVMGPFKALAPFTKIRVSLEYDLKRATFSDATLLSDDTEDKISMNGLNGHSEESPLPEPAAPARI